MSRSLRRRVDAGMAGDDVREREPSGQDNGVASARRRGAARGGDLTVQAGPDIATILDIVYRAPNGVLPPVAERHAATADAPPDEGRPDPSTEPFYGAPSFHPDADLGASPGTQSWAKRWITLRTTTLALSAVALVLWVWVALTV